MIKKSEEKVSQVTDVIEQEYEIPFGIHVNKEKLVNISFGVTLIMILQKIYSVLLI